jgi:hypothetical protein
MDALSWKYHHQQGQKGVRFFGILKKNDEMLMKDAGSFLCFLLFTCIFLPSGLFENMLAMDCAK